jgi:hypothetical protein
MTLVEFLVPLLKAGRREQCLAALYFHQRYKNRPSLTAAEVRQALTQARMPGAKQVNTADVLAKSGHLVDTVESNDRGHKLWKLTPTGSEYVRGMLGLPAKDPEIEHDVSSLEDLAASILDEVVRGYVNEAVLCLSVDALRAAVVFLWTGAIRSLQEAALNKGGAALNAALQKHDQRAKHVSKIEDFAAIKDSISLLAAREIGLLDKGEWQTLNEALGLRNRCGHPTKYRPGEKKVSGFIEDLIAIVFK